MAPRTLRSALLSAALAAALLTAAGCEISIAESPSAGSTADAAGARDRLTRLRVAKPGLMRGYSRDKFPTWRSTGKNCNVRDSVLKRDGTKVRTSGCNVVAGTWTSVYDGRVLDSPTTVDIDPVVPMADAWRSGASAWTTERREDFANDLDRPQLIAVSQTSNRAKGDQDPSTWKPPATESWCEYAVDWIAVKSYWQLTVTTDEKAALTDLLENCR